MTSWKARVIAAVLFATAFGYVEAAVVVYLRAIYQPIRLELHPGISPRELLPAITLDELKARGHEVVRQLYVELGRELATLVMLASVAWGICRSRREWFALFALMFAVWDIGYYAFLRLTIGWPTSFFDWDILFLLPVIWTGPVIAPVLVSGGLILGSVWALVREARGRPLRLPLWCWFGMVTAGVVVITAFCWDWRNIQAGGEANPFRWDVFLTGLLGGLAVFLLGVARTRKGAA
jgi:hypothetical protein